MDIISDYALRYNLVEIRSVQVVKVISIKSSIGKRKMTYREITDLTVTTCTPADVVPTVCAGNKVRNMIALSGCGVGMVPAPFFVGISAFGLSRCTLLSCAW